jgi:hypothetical protein
LQKIHAYESQYSSCVLENNNTKIQSCDGASYERSYKSHGDHEQNNETARNTKDYDGIRKAIRNDGYERRNDG